MKIHHFTIGKSLKQHGQGNFFFLIQKKSPPLEEVMNLPQFLEDLGIFLTFFFLKSSHLTNRFYWLVNM